jgi:hypothetical protein
LSSSNGNSRARANHALYLAKIVLSAWRRELQRQDIPATVLTQAFHGAAREHLTAAYGWFLLALSQGDSPARGLPRCCDDLPPMPEGRVFPGEINEFRQLETAGWLADMLREQDLAVPAPRQPGNLAMAGGDLPGTEQVANWIDQLQALFERMGDSLDEY